VIAQQTDAAASDDQIQALARVGAVSDNVAQTVDFINALIGDMREHGLQGFEVAVNIADDRALHRSVDPMMTTIKTSAVAAARPHRLARAVEFSLTLLSTPV
jgi:hypothetical protein